MKSKTNRLNTINTHVITSYSIHYTKLYESVLLTSCTGTKCKLKIETVDVKAPFEMPAISYPDFKACPNFVITDFGAVPGNQQKTSEAIAKAIDAANEAGGGSVVIPQGEWLTGTIHLKSNVNLYLSKDAVLLFPSQK